ncbi:MAG TPA: alpha-L-arabinofuranosidase C-terminal domain-containing protein [Terriglobia bacterium]|nr:alpha-L-arabinofuranosidase C-terminal domain-containing protein [Terriglobia bacterium]
MTSPMSRREFGRASAALSLSALMPKRAFGDPASGTHQITVRTDSEIGVVRPEFHGQFAEHLGSCVYGGIWVGKSSSIPNVNGYRKETVEYLKALGVPVLRWPGGCFADDYHWRDGIGPPAQRPKRVNLHWGEYVEDNSFGTHEFIGFCRMIGAEPYFAGNVGSGSPRELRDWMEYCNYPGGSTLSNERVSNGSPEPFRVRLWGVGNESWGCGGAMKPDEYADCFRRFKVYLHGFGGIRPYLVSSGPNTNDVHWSRGVMDRLGRDLPGGMSMHYYEWGVDPPTDYTVDATNQQLATFGLVEQAIIQQRDLLNGYDEGGKVGLILDEWGVWDKIPPEDEKRYGRLWQQSTMRSAVAAGLGLNIFNRQADKLHMCNIAQMVNVLQSMLLTDGSDGTHCVRTTSYYAFLLFKPHRSKTAVRVETDDSSPLALSVSASKGNRETVISFVNPRHDQDIQVSCLLKGARATSAKARILHDSDLNACNTFDQPDRVVPQSHPVTLDGSAVRLDVPRLSVATVLLQTQA